MKRRRILAFIGGILTTFALAPGLKLFTPVPMVAQSNTTILVSAAASLQDALEAIKPLFEQAQPTIRVNHNFGSSGALQKQIEQGAPADVFFSAGISQMDALEQANLLVPGTRRNLLSNRLVLIVPNNSTTTITGFRQLTDSRVRRISVGEFRSVPAGQYSEQVLDNLGILEEVRPKIVFANNVRGVLAAVESGNVDAGMVYATDAKISDQVRQVATAPEQLHSPIIYPIAVVKDSRNANAASTYLQFLSSPQARKVFRRFGFSLAP